MPEVYSEQHDFYYANRYNRTNITDRSIANFRIMKRTRIKICGITRTSDALDAISLGVDALGFVFVKKSARCVTSDQCERIISQLPPFVQTVGLFMDATEEFVSTILQEVPLDLLQFHGAESPGYCEIWQKNYLKAIPMGNGNNPTEFVKKYTSASGFLMDSHMPGQLGGSGDVFDWSSIPVSFTEKPLILAGGLTAENVSEAIKQVKPYAVDVSSGVESKKGIKSIDKMRAFVEGVKIADEKK